MLGLHGIKHIETKSADRTDEVLNCNDPRFYSMISLCNYGDKPSDVVRKWEVHLSPGVAKKNYRRDGSLGV
jgi:hypothetical protein